MIYLKDFKGFEKGWTAKRKTVEASTDQDILADASVRCYL